MKNNITIVTKYRFVESSKYFVDSFYVYLNKIVSNQQNYFLTQQLLH